MHSETPGWVAFLVIDGVVQLAGLSVMIAGLAMDEPEPTVAVLPMLGDGLAGLALASTLQYRCP